MKRKSLKMGQQMKMSNQNMKMNSHEVHEQHIIGESDEDLDIDSNIMTLLTSCVYYCTCMSS